MGTTTKVSAFATTTNVAPLSPPPPRRQLIVKRLLWLVNLFVTLYSLLAFVLTSSIVDVIFSRHSVFVDDIRSGFYNFEPLTSADRDILDAMANANPSGQCKSAGARDGSYFTPALGSTASWCHRLNVDMGTLTEASYNGDDVRRRILRMAHIKLQVNCTGWTVPKGGTYADPPLLYVGDARKTYGQAYLNCSADPRIMRFTNTSGITSFPFRAGYVVVQQPFAGSHYSVEAHFSYCKAVRVPNTSDIFSVSPRIDGDTNDYVSLLFTNKNALLWVLDFGGQVVVLLILMRISLFSTLGADVVIPMTPVSVTDRVWSLVSPSHHEQTTRKILQSDDRHDTTTEDVNAGPSRLSFSQIWLSNPFYLIGNCMYALGTSIESQVMVQVAYYQWGITGGLDQAVEAGIYAMRHAWVSVGIWTVIRLFATVTDIPFVPRCAKLLTRRLEMYCSSRIIVLAFILSSLTATLTRGTWYLTNRVNAIDIAYGYTKPSVWQSEIMQSLSINHALGLVFGGTLAILVGLSLENAYPNHRRNSLVQVIDANRRCAGFDIAQLLNASTVVHIDGHCVLILPLADLFIHFSSVNIVHYTTMAALPKTMKTHAIRLSTNGRGTVLVATDSGVHVPELEQIARNAPTKRIYCAVI
ncbi:Aste57867_19729 [Aphanomyces stellatus]|uniref:Aste57867_19729 protein n=1 Tax=Aphanomyces stellatus TaxID=120398 RepID=A0A485LDW8_9STRA|nr:hypothetical protein As57867_019664 [Aphanomyces stellatus]VFT96427.1 Aste57867_19729 [Aphanomyces stellatus]